MAKEELKERLLEIMQESKDLRTAWIEMLVHVRTFTPEITVEEAYNLMEEAENRYINRLEMESGSSPA